jgi:hypothetical protein
MGKVYLNVACYATLKFGLSLAIYPQSWYIEQGENTGVTLDLDKQ